MRVVYDGQDRTTGAVLRRAMQRNGVETLALYAEERNTHRPTAEQVLRLFSLVQRHVLEHEGEHVRSFEPELTELQLQVLELLGVPKTPIELLAAAGPCTSNRGEVYH